MTHRVSSQCAYQQGQPQRHKAAQD